MNILLIASCIIISMMLIVRDKQSRLLAFFVGITFLPFGLEVSYKLSAPRIFVVAFFVSVLFRSHEMKSVKHMPGSFLLLLVFVSHLLTGIFDQRLSLVQGVSKALVMFAETFGGVILGYVSFGTKTKEKKLLKTILVLAFLVGVYSVFCFAIKADPYSASIGDTDSMNDDRHRIASFFFNSHLGGLAMSIYLILLLYFRQKYKFSAFQNFIAVLLFISLILTKSRSSLLDLIAGSIVLYSALLFQSSSKMKYMGTSLVSLFILYLFVGESIVSQFTDAFREDGGTSGGSNATMRLQQLAFSWDLFLKNPIFGNGFNYFWDEIKAKDQYLSSMLLGAESYVFILLIERGLIQIITILLYFVGLYRYLLKNKCQESYLCMALLTAFLVNSVVTGNTYKWIFVMPFVGYYLRYVQFKKRIE